MAGAPDSLEAVARLIQLSLTPVFLLSGLAALLSVFATRLARVADRVDQIAIELERAGPGKTQRLIDEQGYQRRRTRTLDVAVVLGALGGMLTCASVLVLFVGALSGAGAAVGGVLFTLFGLAICAAIGALAAFGYEMLLASMGVRRKSRRMMSDLAEDEEPGRLPAQRRRRVED